MSIGVEPPLEVIAKVKFKMNLLVFEINRRFQRSALYLPCWGRRDKSAGSWCTFGPARSSSRVRKMARPAAHLPGPAWSRG